MDSFEESRMAPLPADARRRLLDAVDAPPRLVHDVADQLLEWMAEHLPEVGVDADAVRFGAAVHDIGKVRHPHELSGPGHDHERAGAALLVEHGAAAERARFCRTQPSGAPPVHPHWQVWSHLDEALTGIAAGSGGWIVFQTRHPLAREPR